MEEKSAVTEANNLTNTDNAQVNDRAPNAKERSILDRLSTIRVGKSKILNTLGMLKEKTDSGENIGKELIEKLLQAYDSLNAQEEEFISTLKRLAGLDEQLPAQITTISSSEVETKLENEADECDDITWEEADKTFGEAEKMAENATTAAHLHDQLKIYIALQEKKKAALDELHRKYMSQKSDESQKALQEVEMSKLKLASESTSLDRKQKQLERLRREAAKRGYIRQGAIPPVEKETAQESNTKKETNPAEHLLEDERVPSIPILPPTSPDNAEVVTEPSQKQHANKDELHNKISERFASFESRKQRMRLLRSKLNQIEESKMDQTYSDALSRLEHLTSVRKQLENMQTEEGETIARNDSAKANQDSGSTHSSSNEADKSTVFGPHSKKSSQDSVDNASVATDELISQVRHSFNSIFHGEGNTATTNAHDMSMPSTSSSDNKPFHSINSECFAECRLRTIENILQNHTEQLTWIGGQIACMVDLLEQVQVNQVQSASPPILHQAKHSSNSAITVVPAETIVTVPNCTATLSPTCTNRVAIPQIPTTLGTLLKTCFASAAPNLIGELTEVVKRGQDTGAFDDEKLDVLIQRLLTPETNMTYTDDATIIPNRDALVNETEPQRLSAPMVNIPQYDENRLPYEDKPTSLDSQYENQYAEPAKAAELEEEIRRASEFLRSQSNDRGSQPLPVENVSQQIEVQSRRETMSAFNGMEQEICAVLEATASWLKLHENEPTEEISINSLRDIMLEKSKEVLPSDVRLASKDFNAQLTTAIDDCLAKYLGTNLALLKDSLIADLSEILYNEFACLKLMYNADHIAEENK
ncbi:pericentriolar material 1 protein [Ditylenchus destructor]|nr:pericentriolar material 1 protein [Ditylenchus destructor]